MKKLGSLLAPLAAVVLFAVPATDQSIAREAAGQVEDKEAVPANAQGRPVDPDASPVDEPNFSIHGEIRSRYEYWKNATDFTNTFSQATDDTMDIVPFRVRFGASVDLGRRITARADLQGIGVWGQTSADGGDEVTRGFFGASIDNGTDVDLYQGWVNFGDIAGSKADVKFGRQEIEFDNGLHFSSEPYYNGVSHDGVMAAWDLENVEIHGFWTRSVEGETGLTTAVAHSDDELLGAHVLVAVGKEKKSDLAYYLFHELGRRDPGAGGRTAISTLGARYSRSLTGATGVIWSVEGAWQEGDIEPSASMNLNHQAYVLEGMIGYNTDKSGSDRRFWAGFYLASGDRNPSDTDQEAFRPLYEELHGRLGDSDIAPLTNIRSLNAGLSADFRENHSFRAEFFQFAKAEEEQASISPISGVTLAPGCFSSSSVSCSTDLGREVDFTYAYRASESLAMGITWAFFLPGSAIEDQFGSLGSSRSGEHAAQRLTLEVRARF